MDLEEYSARVEMFSSELAREYYRHFAGLQADFAIGSVYERHADLFELGAVQELRSAAARAPADSERARRLRALLRFAVEGHLGAGTRALDAELARRESSLSVEVIAHGGGVDRVGFRDAALVQANEPDPDRRAQIEAARLATLREALTPLAGEALERRHALARELGWASYRALWQELMGVDLAALAHHAAAFLAAGQERYAAAVEPALRRTVGVGLADLRRSDLPWLYRNAQADAHFPERLLMPTFSATLRALGIDPDGQPSVVLDLERRPHKSPRAFCAPVRVPDEIYLVVPRVGGREDYIALLHEGGHAQHFAGVDPRLPFELRRLGDQAVTEAFAFLFDRLADEPAWLRSHLQADDGDGSLAEHARAQRVIFLRRHAAKLGYELELHDRDGHRPGLADAYAERLSAALGVKWPSETWLTDVDPGFYVANYLRAWALEAQLRRALRERFGAAWFQQPAAGDYLKTLWWQGQRLTAEELLAQVRPGAGLDLVELAGEP